MLDFSAQFRGPGGDYRLSYAAERDEVAVLAAGQSMTWSVEVREPAAGTLAGLTRGSAPVWSDVFWFVLFAEAPRKIEYWGDRVLVRVDHEL